MISRAVRQHIARELEAMAALTVDMARLWPETALSELPRAAAEEAAAIMTDAATELRREKVQHGAS